MKKICALLLVMTLCLSIAPLTMAETTELPSVAIIIAGGLGDRSFYDSANGGLELLKATYPGIVTGVMECKEDPSLFEQTLSAAAESYDIIVAVGWQFWDALTLVAPQMPEKKFIFVDNAMEGIDNVFSITYAENQGSFLVGYIAAKLSETGIIGMVGGADDVTINNFFVGYRQGAQYANPAVQVEVSYTADYEDPAKGKEHALALYDRGADIVFQVAGKTGEGVFQAAAEVGKYAIGVDGDQKYINPDVILCSMVKEVGVSIHDAVVDYVENGNFPGGTVWNADMANNYIAVAYGDDSMPQQVGEELKAEVAALAAMIESGEIVVETTR
ncbi:MAG: BMP family ABC transporter substrate-binding protein [Oscillospiraceae bacterium]|nr:BMP family ABC transporter substrate-binding protein [Oscillospiraceae bacterium]